MKKRLIKHQGETHEGSSVHMVGSKKMAEEIPAVVGRVCLSRSGRDKGRYFMVTEVLNQDYVMIADGVMRKLAKPKRKKIRHLRMKPIVLDVIGGKLQEGKKVFDAELKSAIINTGLVAQKEEE